MSDLLNPVGGKHVNSLTGDNAAKNNPEQMDQTFEEGVIEIPLPSKGLFYGPPFRMKETVNVIHLDWRAEDILTTKEFINDGSVFDRVVSFVIQDKGLTAKHLVPIDRDTILMWLRSTSMGNIMSIDYKCPKCSEDNKAEWDMTKFEIPSYPAEIEAQLAEKGEIEIVTPLSELKVFVKLPNIGESKDTEKRLLKKKSDKKVENDFIGTGSLMLIVAGIETKEGKIIRNKTEIENYFNKIKLPLGDSRYIRNKAAELNLQYDTKKDFSCSNPKCDHVREGVEMPIVHPNFLWTDGIPQ